MKADTEELLDSERIQKVESPVVCRAWRAVLAVYQFANCASGTRSSTPVSVSFFRAGAPEALVLDTFWPAALHRRTPLGPVLDGCKL